MSRTKTVFKMSQCAHVWAQQKQREGRTPSGKLYFIGDKIYSYGSHYVIAQIYRGKNKKPFALVNSHGYSMQTGMHRNAVTGALKNLMPFYYSNTPENLKATLKRVADAVKTRHEYELSRTKISRKDEFKLFLEYSSLETTNELRALVGLKPLKYSAKQLKLIKDHFTARYKRYLELNTPEMLAKKEAAKKKKEDAEALKQQQADEQKVIDFRAGKNVRTAGFLALLRINESKKEVVTSHGASVPLDAATKMVDAIVSGEIKPDANDYVNGDDGIAIGEFTLNKIEVLPDDSILHVGCHRISLQEAVNVLKGGK